MINSLYLSQDELRQRFLAMLQDCPQFDCTQGYIQTWASLFNGLGVLTLNVNEHHNSGTIYNLKHRIKREEDWSTDVPWEVNLNNSPGQEYETAIAHIVKTYGNVINWKVKTAFDDYKFTNIETKGDRFENTSTPDNKYLIWFLRYLTTGELDKDLAPAIQICEQQLGIKTYSSDPLAQSFDYLNFSIRTYKNRKFTVTGLTVDQAKRLREFLRVSKISPTYR